MMTDKIEEMIREIAVKHGIAIGRDDPILVLQTMNDRLMQESTAAQQANLNAFKSELEEIAYRWGDDAKNKAERTLNAALNASKDAMAVAIDENTKAITTAVKKQIETSISLELQSAILEARYVSYMNLIAAGMTVFAAGLVVWAAW